MLCFIYLHFLIFILACGEHRPFNHLWQKITTTNWCFQYESTLKIAVSFNPKPSPKSLFYSVDGPNGTMIKGKAISAIGSTVFHSCCQSVAYYKKQWLLLASRGSRQRSSTPIAERRPYPLDAHRHEGADEGATSPVRS